MAWPSSHLNPTRTQFACTSLPHKKSHDPKLSLTPLQQRRISKGSQAPEIQRRQGPSATHAPREHLHDPQLPNSNTPHRGPCRRLPRSQRCARLGSRALRLRRHHGPRGRLDRAEMEPPDCGGNHHRPAGRQDPDDCTDGHAGDAGYAACVARIHHSRPRRGARDLCHLLSLD